MSSLLDTSVLLYVLNENTPAPLDPHTGQPVTRCRDRVNELIAQLSKASEKVIVPTPVLAEVLVRAETAAPAYLAVIEKSKALRIRSFDALAAVEASTMMAKIYTTRKPVGGDARSKMKFDVIIAAMAKVERVKTVYSDDPDLRQLGADFGFAVVGVADLPLPAGSTPDMFADLED